MGSFALRKSGLVLAILIAARLAFASDYTRPICSAYFDQLQATRAPINWSEAAGRSDIEAYLNENMLKRFPGLAEVVGDPDAFIAKMDARFEAQKKLTPDDPHQFDYSEVGIPMLQRMRAALERKLAEITDGTKKASKSERKIATEYLQSLMAEIDGKLAKGAVSYRDMIEISTFYSRIAGYFDPRSYALRHKLYLLIDRYIEGYKPLSIEKEYELYKNRRFTLFQEGMGKGALGFQDSEKPYVDAFQNKEKLSAIIVPTDQALTCDILMRLMSREKISLIGTTAEPIQADGFLRNSGYFWYHDLRHESAKYTEKMNYMKLHGIPDAKETELNQQMDKWFVEMESSIAKIDEPNLRAAVEFLTFNIYHDRGFPITPSTFPPELARSPQFFTALSLVIGKEGLEFKHPIRSIIAAENWLREYWAPKQAEEERFLSGLKADSTH